MTRPLLQILLFVVVGMSCLAPIVGTSSWRRHNAGERATWWWLVLAAALNIMMLTTTMRGIRNAQLAWATFPIYALVGVRALVLLQPQARVRTAFWIGFVAYCIAWLVTGMPREGFSSFAGPLLWILLCAAATVVLILRITETRTPLHDFGTLIAIAVLVTYLPGLALEPLSTTLHAERPQLVLQLWIGRQALAVLGSLIFAWAYLARRTPA